MSIYKRKIQRDTPNSFVQHHYTIHTVVLCLRSHIPHGSAKRVCRRKHHARGKITLLQQARQPSGEEPRGRWGAGQQHRRSGGAVGTGQGL